MTSSRTILKHILSFLASVPIPTRCVISVNLTEEQFVDLLFELNAYGAFPFSDAVQICGIPIKVRA